MSETARVTDAESNMQYGLDSDAGELGLRMAKKDRCEAGAGA
jgi:hypothetical protein